MPDHGQPGAVPAADAAGRAIRNRVARYAAAANGPPTTTTPSNARITFSAGPQSAHALRHQPRAAYVSHIASNRPGANTTKTASWVFLPRSFCRTVHGRTPHQCQAHDNEQPGELRPSAACGEEGD